jgi:hypothetical protein
MLIRPATAADAEPMAIILCALGWIGHLAAEAAEDTADRVARHLDAYLAWGGRAAAVVDGR